MSSSAAFYQTFYQNDTLFQRNDHTEKVSAAIEKPAAPIAQPQVTKTPVTQSIPATAPTEVAKPKPVPQPQQLFPPLNHKILILTDDGKNKELAGPEALLLDNILKAVGHASEKTDILNFSFLPGADARQVLSEKRINHFITFGVPLIKLHLDLLLVPYAPKQVEGIWFLLADPLVVIESDKALKKKLWIALQKMFEKA